MKPEREMARLLDRAFDGRLTVEERIRLEALAASEPCCAAELEQHRVLIDALEGLPEPADQRLDVERSLAAIHAGIERGEPRPVARPRVWRRAAAAAAAIVIGLGAWHFTRDAVPVAPVAETTVLIADTDTDRGMGTVPEATTSAVVADADSSSVLRYPRAELPATDFDADRLARVRAEVRSGLAGAARGVDLARAGVEELERFATRFESATAELASSDWPVDAVVRGLIEDEDAQLAAAAARYLALRAPRQAAPRMLAAFESAGSNEHRLALVAAFADAARTPHAADFALNGLLRAHGEPALTARVLACVRGLEPALVLSFAVDGIERGVEPRELAELLGELGFDGALVLLELTGRGTLETELALDVLEHTSSAPEALLAVLGGDGGLPEGVLLLALERLRPADALPRLVELCQEGDDRALAAKVLAGYPGVPALLELLLVGESGRLRESDFLTAVGVAVRTDAERLSDPAVIGAGGALNVRRRERLLELLAVTAEIASVPALIELAMDPDLPSADREHALLMAAELGGVEHVTALAAKLPHFDAAEHRLAAACLFATHRLGGHAPAANALAFLDASPRTRLLDHLSDPRAARRPTTTLYKLARELEPALDARDRRPRKLNP
ncbi:MAG: hypothetical protein GY711_34590 [bacterium]|nr:hypothetical protein [bacterium]